MEGWWRKSVVLSDPQLPPPGSPSRFKPEQIVTPRLRSQDQSRLKWHNESHHSCLSDPACHACHSHHQSPAAAIRLHSPTPASGKSLEADMLCLLTATRLVSLSLPQPVPDPPSLAATQAAISLAILALAPALNLPGEVISLPTQEAPDTSHALGQAAIRSGLAGIVSISCNPVRQSHYLPSVVKRLSFPPHSDHDQVVYSLRANSHRN